MPEPRWLKIGDICSIEKGVTGLASATPGEYPLVATGADRRSAQTYQFNTKAVCIPLVSSTGHGKKTLNYVHYQEGKFALGTILAAVIPKDKKVLDARYLYTYLQMNKDRVLVPLMRGAANVSLSVSAISDINIPVPSLGEQKKALSKLDSMSGEHAELLLETDKQLELLKQLRRQILQDAIEGKLTADWRKKNPALITGENHASKLLKTIKSKKSRLIQQGKLKKEKPLPPITETEKPFPLPEVWVWCRLEEILETLSTGPFGSMLHKADYVKSGIPIINPMHLVDRKILPDERMLISEETRERLKRYMLRQGDIVIARRGNLEKCAIVNKEEEGWLCGTGSFYLRLLGVNRDFFVLLYCSKKAQAYLLQDSIGQTMDNLNQTMLGKLPISLPSLHEQKEIIQRVDKFMRTIGNLGNQVIARKSQSEMLMQSVLKEAFEGK